MYGVPRIVLCIGTLHHAGALHHTGTHLAHAELPVQATCGAVKREAISWRCSSTPSSFTTSRRLLSAASCLSWVARATGAADEAALLAEIEQADRPSGRLLFLPYLSGERTPHNDPAARGVFFGLDHEVDRAALGRAVLEGVAFAFATTPLLFAAITNAPSSRHNGQRNSDPCALAALCRHGVQSAAGQQSIPSPSSPQTRHGVVVMARGPGALCGAISLRRRLILPPLACFGGLSRPCCCTYAKD